MAATPSIIEYLEAGIKGAGIRQATIANNIANIGTPGYRRLAVEFEKRLADAMADGKSLDVEDLAKDVMSPKNTPIDADGNDVSLEMEIGEMVHNTGMQKTYLRLLARAYQKMESAMSIK